MAASAVDSGRRARDCAIGSPVPAEVGCLQSPPRTGTGASYRVRPAGPEAAPPDALESAFLG